MVLHHDPLLVPLRFTNVSLSNRQENQLFEDAWHRPKKLRIILLCTEPPSPQPPPHPPPVLHSSRPLPSPPWLEWKGARVHSASFPSPFRCPQSSSENENTSLLYRPIHENTPHVRCQRNVSCYSNNYRIVLIRPLVYFSARPDNQCFLIPQPPCRTVRGHL